MPLNSTTTLGTPLGKAPRRASAPTTAKPPATTGKRSGEPAKPVTSAKPAARAKLASPAKRPATRGGQLTIAILAGLALGLVTLVIYGFAKPSGPWAFDRPEAKLPSLQAKHTLY